MGSKRGKGKRYSLLSKLKSGTMTLNKFFESGLCFHWFKVYTLDNYGGWPKKANVIMFKTKPVTSLLININLQT